MKIESIEKTSLWCRAALLAAVSWTVPWLQGCGGTVHTGLVPTLSPATSTIQVGEDLTFAGNELPPDETCTWASSAPAVLAPLGGGRYHGQSAGNASASLTCNEGPLASAAVVVTSKAPGPLVITKGGTYAGTWTSDDPAVPAVHILTDDPVTLHNSTLTSRGDLIDIDGGTGANVTIENVTGTALDPRIAGTQRGSFVSAHTVAKLTVQHCSMYGVSDGVRVQSSTLSSLVLSQNLARELEDRASNGLGGLEPARPNLGHFIFLWNVQAPSGADIGWNQVVDTIGQSSTEDVINIFKSQGSPVAPIRVHDNYLEGYSSSTTPSYTGAGLIADGDSYLPVPAYITFEINQMVHTAGSGIEIAAGHDILIRNNSVVSCGVDPHGHWFAMPFVNAVVFWNYYRAPEFSHNTVEGTRGGVLKPDPNNQPVTGDLYARAADLDATDSYSGQHFTDPCFVNGSIHLQAEDAERALWASKLADAHIAPGAQPQ